MSVWYVYDIHVPVSHAFPPVVLDQPLPAARSMLCFEALLYMGSLTMGGSPFLTWCTWLGQPETEPAVLSISDPMPLFFYGYRTPESEINKWISREKVNQNKDRQGGVKGVRVEVECVAMQAGWGWGVRR